MALTRQRVAAEVASKFHMKQAEAALPATRVQLATISESIALTRNQLAALQGKGPDAGSAIGHPTLARDYDTSIPAELSRGTHWPSA